MHAIYRVRQGLDHLASRDRPEDDGLAGQYLDPSEVALFAGMQPADRRHCAAVLRTLLAEGETEPDLLKAALLHDVGKADCGIGILHRTAAVVLRWIFGSVPTFLTWPSRRGLLRPFYVLENHPRLGACALARAGCAERVWRLTELHHTDPEAAGPLLDATWIDRALRALQAADAIN